MAKIKANPNVAFALIIEPDSLPNLVTNSDLTTCQNSASGYRQGVAYALKNLNLPNVMMYIDAGHGGWLGWDANLKPGAQELANAYKNAGSPKQVRGFSTNVAGWNAWYVNFYVLAPIALRSPPFHATLPRSRIGLTNPLEQVPFARRVL